MSVHNELSVLSDSLPVPLPPERTMEIILDALRELIDYELAVVLRLEGTDWLRVSKAVGPLYTRKLDNFAISLEKRQDLAGIMLRREPHLFDENEPHVDTYYEVLDLPEGHSCLVSPLFVGDKSIGLLTFDHRVCDKFTPAVVRFVATISKLISVTMDQSETSTQLMNRTRKLIQERNRLIGEAAGVFNDLIGVSSSWERVLEALRLVAVSSVPVLLLGETGTGKEQVARKLHQLSERAAEAFVAVNCSALVPSLAESELFGHEKGSFSGAVGTRRGRFEMADGGTLFLDEVGDLPVELQPKLLRVLQDGVFERVGGEKSLTVDVRIIAATNINLERAVREGKFREDLLYRLNVFPIFLPPLRDRGEDAALLAEYFVSLIRKRPGFENTALSKSAVIKIIALPWRGNVRELRNVIERAAILSRGGLIEEDHVFPGMTACVSENEPQAPEHEPPAAPHGADHVPLSLEEVQRTHITQVLERCGGKIYGPKGAAALLKIKPTTLQSRMLKLGIRGA